MSRLPSLSASKIATPEPYAVGKCLASVIPESWTKSIPAVLAISVKRNGLFATGAVGFARTIPTSGNNRLVSVSVGDGDGVAGGLAYRNSSDDAYATTRATS